MNFKRMDSRGTGPSAPLHLRTEGLIHLQQVFLSPGDQDSASLYGGSVGCRESSHLWVVPGAQHRLCQNLHKWCPLGPPGPKLHSYTGPDTKNCVVFAMFDSVLEATRCIWEQKRMRWREKRTTKIATNYPGWNLTKNIIFIAIEELTILPHTCTQVCGLRAIVTNTSLAFPKSGEMPGKNHQDILQEVH